MILGNGYDRALWLLLNVNNDDKNNIIDLVKGIPCELYNRINNSIYILNKYKNDGCSQDFGYLHGNIIIDDKMFYYRIDPYSYCISLGRSKKEDNSYNEEIELCLSCISNEEIFNGYNLLIGSIQYNNGDIRKLCLGDFVLSWDFCRYALVTTGFDDVQNIDIVNVKNIPNNLDYSDLIKDRIFVKKRG